MVSLRFPFSFPQFPRPPFRRRHAAAAAAAAAVAGIGFGLAVSCKSVGPFGQPRRNHPLGPASPLWASLSLADGSHHSASVEPRTGTAFPEETAGGRRLLGVGLRKSNILGLKTIDVYAFGVYADENDMKQLNQKYGALSISELKENKELITDALEHDIQMTVRLQIVYGRLSIRSVRSAFEKSVGNRLQKFGGPDTKDLLQSFVSLFKDEYKLPKGSVIELSREQSYVLQTKIGGEDLGSIQSKLLCQAILDLYIGEDPFDKNAKDKIQQNMAGILKRDA